MRYPKCLSVFSNSVSALGDFSGMKRKRDVGLQFACRHFLANVQNSVDRLEDHI